MILTQLAGVIGAGWGRGDVWSDFVGRLPALVRELLEEWQLAPDGDATHGRVAVVQPVRTTGGRPAVLKVGFPHEAAEHEHLALRHWDGRGAVRLLRADPHRHALLLERLHREDLDELWDVEACEVVAGLYGRLHVPAPPQLRRVATYVETWARDLEALPRDAPVPRRLVEQAVATGRELVAEDRPALLLHTDLHGGNVLAADREEWLAIDPEPMAGDPCFEPAPMLAARWEDLVGAHRSLRDGIRLRFHTLVDAAGLDEDRARGWVVVRAVVAALRRLQDPDGVGADLSLDEHLTRCVTLAKAVQD